MSTASLQARGRSAQALWIALWGCLLVLFAAMAVDGWSRGVPAVVWVVWYLPLVVLVPGMLRDRLRSVAWLSFVTLMYFVVDVQRLFAEPGSVRAQIELLAVIGLFMASMFYVRQRGRELRAAASVQPGDDS